MNALEAFGTGVLQVFLVSLNVRQIAAKARLWKILLVAAGISSVWIMNVRAANGTAAAGAAYVFGATIGTAIAMRVRVKAGE